MIETRQTDDFAEWLKRLETDDARAAARIAQRIDRVRHGNFGDVASAGDGVSELRVHYGPGYRVYLKRVGLQIVLLLCGGDKSTQKQDIIRAKELAEEV